MYIVASTWEVAPGQSRDEVDRLGKEMRSRIRATPGVELLEHFPTRAHEVMVIVGYKDEPTYHSIIDDPNGVFQKGLAELDLESKMTWKQSWRGEAVPH